MSLLVVSKRLEEVLYSRLRIDDNNAADMRKEIMGQDEIRLGALGVQ